MKNFQRSLIVFFTMVMPSLAIVSVGEKAPNFTLNDHTGQPFTLAQKLGKPVVIFFMGFS